MDAYMLEVERQLKLENGFIDDIQYTKSKILRLMSVLEYLT